MLLCYKTVFTQSHVSAHEEKNGYDAQHKRATVETAVKPGTSAIGRIGRILEANANS